MFTIILPLGIYLGILIALIIVSVAWFKEKGTGAKVAGTIFALIALTFVGIPAYMLLKG